MEEHGNEPWCIELHGIGPYGIEPQGELSIWIFKIDSSYNSRH